MCELFGKAQIHRDHTSQSDVAYDDNVNAQINQILGKQIKNLAIKDVYVLLNDLVQRKYID